MEIDKMKMTEDEKEVGGGEERKKQVCVCKYEV